MLRSAVAGVRLDLMLETVLQEGIALVICRGRVLHGATARHFRERIGDELSRRRRVIVDLQGVTHMDARGLGMLAVLIRQAGTPRDGLVVATKAGRISYLLRLTGLDTLVECVPSHAFRDMPASEQAGHLVRV